jgi:hypothetical protein
VRDHGGQIVSLVEAVFEFGEGARDMLAVDGTVCSCDGGLDVAEGRVDPFEGRRLSCLWSRPGLDDLVRTASFGDAGETLKTVADDRAVWIEAALGEPRERGCTEAGDPAQLQANRLSPGGRLDGCNERRLARRPAASPSARAFAAERRRRSRSFRSGAWSHHVQA